MEARAVVHTRSGNTVEMGWAVVSEDQLKCMRIEASKHASGCYDLWSGGTTVTFGVHKGTNEVFIPRSSIDYIEIQIR